MKKIFVFTVVLLTVGLAVVLVQDVSAQDSTGIVLPEGSAWIKGGTGYVFQSDGTFLSINNYDGKEFGKWCVVSNGTWSVRGNTLTITANYAMNYTFTLSDNTLSLTVFGSTETYTRTVNINPYETTLN